MINSSLKYKLLIERQDQGLWRVVARKLAPHGFAKNYIALSWGHDNLEAARTDFQAQRRGNLLKDTPIINMELKHG